MSKKIAFLFPGQGSQFIGMGRDLVDEFPEIAELFKETDRICRKPISALCFEGPMAELTLTENLQPAITAVNLACLTGIRDSGIEPTVSAGHSLGEYAALVSAGAIHPHDALRLVQKRGELMHREALAHPGSMAAVMKLDSEAVEEIVAKARDRDILSVANHNTAEQTVITGQEEPITRAIQMVTERRGRAIPLNVSGAWHSMLMKGAVKEFREFMEDVPFETPRSKVLFNATAQAETNVDRIKDVMAEQLVSPVKWHHIILSMLKDGIEIFVEVGPKKVLTGLLRKTISPGSEVKTYTVQDLKSLKDFLAKIWPGHPPFGPL